MGFRGSAATQAIRAEGPAAPLLSATWLGLGLGLGLRLGLGIGLGSELG